MAQPPVPATEEQDRGDGSEEQQQQQQHALQAQGSQQNQKRCSDHVDVGQPHLHAGVLSDCQPSLAVF